MITIIARLEDQQMPEELDWRMWRQIKGAFAVDRFVMVETDEDVEREIKKAKGKLVFLEPKGHRPISKIPKGDIILIFGNTQRSNMHLSKSPKNNTYRIETPTKTDMYGTNAAAIVLALRYGQ